MAQRPPTSASIGQTSLQKASALSLVGRLSSIGVSGVVALDVGGTSDPYVTWWISGEGAGPPNKRTTSVAHKRTTAVFAETFSLDVSVFSVESLKKLYLELEVFDRNTMVADELIGRAHVDLYTAACGARHYALVLTTAPGPSAPAAAGAGTAVSAAARGSSPATPSVGSPLLLAGIAPPAAATPAASAAAAAAALAASAPRGVLTFELTLSQAADSMAVVSDVVAELQLDDSVGSIAGTLLRQDDPFSPVGRPTRAAGKKGALQLAQPAPSVVGSAADPDAAASRPARAESMFPPADGAHDSVGTQPQQQSAPPATLLTSAGDAETLASPHGLPRSLMQLQVSAPESAAAAAARRIAAKPPRLLMQASFAFDFALPGAAVALTPHVHRYDGSNGSHGHDHGHSRSRGGSASAASAVASAAASAPASSGPDALVRSPHGTSRGAGVIEADPFAARLEFTAGDVRTGPNSATLTELLRSALVLRIVRADTLAPVFEAYVPLAELPLTLATHGHGSGSGSGSGSAGTPSGLGSVIPPVTTSLAPSTGATIGPTVSVPFVAPLFVAAEADKARSEAEALLALAAEAASPLAVLSPKKRSASGVSSFVAASNAGAASGDGADEGGYSDADSDSNSEASVIEDGGEPLRRTVGVVRGSICFARLPSLTQLIAGRCESYRGVVNAVMLTTTQPHPPTHVWSYAEPAAAAAAIASAAAAGVHPGMPLPAAAPLPLLHGSAGAAGAAGVRAPSPAAAAPPAASTVTGPKHLPAAASSASASFAVGSGTTSLSPAAGLTHPPLKPSHSAPMPTPHTTAAVGAPAAVPAPPAAARGSGSSPAASSGSGQSQPGHVHAGSVSSAGLSGRWASAFGARAPSPAPVSAYAGPAAAAAALSPAAVGPVPALSQPPTAAFVSVVPPPATAAASAAVAAVPKAVSLPSGTLGKTPWEWQLTTIGAQPDA